MSFINKNYAQQLVYQLECSIKFSNCTYILNNENLDEITSDATSMKILLSEISYQ